MPARKSRHGREYGVEDETGNVLIEPSLTTKGKMRAAGNRLAEERAESVYMFEVGRDTDGTRIIVDREELRPRAGLTTAHIQELHKKQQSLERHLKNIPQVEGAKKTPAQLQQEIDKALRSWRRK